VPPLTALKDPLPVAKEVPDIIQDPNSKRRYEKGKFLGKGGFAKCYELKDLATGEMLAGKIVPKAMLTKTHQKDKMSQVRKLKCVRHVFPYGTCRYRTIVPMLCIRIREDLSLCMIRIRIIGSGPYLDIHKRSQLKMLLINCIT